MDSFKFTTPLVFIIFNKVETTKKVFEVIRKIQPTKLFVIADGPRSNKPNENAVCNDVRNLTEQIDWDCEVFRNYSSDNLGCKKRIVSGLDWVFQNVDEAVILEDDCLPDVSFFRFCQEMLKKYMNDERVMMISGNNILPNIHSEKSYYFSNFVHIWGWATWKRSWRQYNFDYSDLSQDKLYSVLLDNLKSKTAIKYWQILIKEVQTGEIDAWSVKLQLLQFVNRSLCIIPARNLVVNLGFDSELATNTKGSGGLYRKMKLESLSFPLSHPNSVVQNIEADKIEIKLFHKFGFKEKIRRFLLKFNIEIR